MDIKLLNERHNKLGKQMNENDLVILFANSMPKYPRSFLQDNNFLYFTELQIPDAVLLIQKIKEKPVLHLFIERGIPEMEVWEGKKMTREETTKISSIKAVSFLDEFERKINFYLSISKKCYVNLGTGNLAEPLSKRQEFAKKITDKFPHIQIEDTTGIITPLRIVKDKWEVKQIQTAIDATGAGIKKIYKEAEAGMMEFELEAMLRYEILRKGHNHLGFRPIIASGVNAATLHYESNNSKIGENDLILLDVGAACNNYSADITRTFPVAGKFTKRQKTVYKEVLSINKKIIKMIKPGVGLTALNQKTVELIQDALLRLKLIKKKEDYREYYMHSVSHHLGMDTHDVGARDSVLKEGNVITVEPGIYISEEKIGVRIEDDILVTKNGCKNLSQKIPKEIEDLEK